MSEGALTPSFNPSITLGPFLLQCFHLAHLLSFLGARAHHNSVLINFCLWFQCPGRGWVGRGPSGSLRVPAVFLPLAPSSVFSLCNSISSYCFLLHVSPQERVPSLSPNSFSLSLEADAVLSQGGPATAGNCLRPRLSGEAGGQPEGPMLSAPSADELEDEKSSEGQEKHPGHRRAQYRPGELVGRGRWRKRHRRRGCSW